MESRAVRGRVHALLRRHPIPATTRERRVWRPQQHDRQDHDPYQEHAEVDALHTPAHGVG